jgi:hypothetical protein
VIQKVEGEGLASASSISKFQARAGTFGAIGTGKEHLSRGIDFAVMKTRSLPALVVAVERLTAPASSLSRRLVHRENNPTMNRRAFLVAAGPPRSHRRPSLNRLPLHRRSKNASNSGLHVFLLALRGEEIPD